MPQLEKTLAGWKGAPGATPAVAGDAPQLTSRKVFLIDKPGAVAAALKRAIKRVKAGQPALIDTITQKR